MKDNNTELKECIICKQIKSTSAFGKNGRWLKSYCKKCYGAYSKARYWASDKASFAVPPIDGEIWKDIPDLQGCYQVSNMGRIKSLERTIAANDGRAIRVQEKILVPRPSRCGYFLVWLYKGDLRKGFSIHRLVAKAFIPNPDNLPEVNHKNGIKSDNRASELEWATSGDNQTHAYKIGLRKSRKGIKLGKRKPVDA